MKYGLFQLNLFLHKNIKMPQTDFINTEHFFNKSLATLKIDDHRYFLLKSIAQYLANEVTNNKIVHINFISFDNSRRSLLAQVWASYAVFFYKLSNIKCFSGGITETAFHRNTVKTLQEVGFYFQITEFSHQNPVYSINYKNGINPIVGFSKLIDDARNLSPYIAILTSNKAAEYFHNSSASLERFNLFYNNLKIVDHTQQQHEKYLETTMQIAGEIHFIFKTVHELI